MNRYVKKIEHFLLTNTVWFFFTSILLIVTGWLMPDFGGETWRDFMGYTFSMIVQFSPILLFAFFRNHLREKLPTLGYWALWFMTFIGFLFLNHPYVYEMLGINAFGSIPMHDGFIPLIMCGLFLLTELVLLSNNFIVQKTSGSSFFKKIDLDHIMFLLVIIIPFVQAQGMKVYLDAANKPLIISEMIKVIALGYFSFFSGFLLYLMNRRFLIPSLLKKKGIVYYGAGIFAVSLMASPILTQMTNSLQALIGLKPFTEIPVFFGRQSYFNILIFLIITAPIIIFFEWMKQSKAIATLEKEKSETELNLLKQQINPHFFFNTLNNLYALSLTKDEQTPEVILQLSELMRYVIYKGKEQEVSLKEEVKYIEDYIQLQEIRLAKKLDFKFEKDIGDLDMKVPPLLFINLVENAFKHGIEPAQSDCFLHLRLKCIDGNLTFVCKNSFEEKENTTDGTGLKNLKRRLELRFPERHELEFKESKNSFTANLVLLKK